jgi:hypothetical protein
VLLVSTVEQRQQIGSSLRRQQQQQQNYSSSTICRMMKIQKPPMPRVLPGTSIASSPRNIAAPSTSTFVGRPPMPRVLPGTTTTTTTTSKASSSSSSSSAVAAAAASAETKSVLNKAKDELLRPGSFLITFGWLLLGVFALDQYLQYYYEQETQRLLTQLKNEEVEQRRRLLEEWKDAPALYETMVHMKYKGMGGTKGLRGVAVQDRLEVLQDNVGPGKTYSLCRKRITTPTPPAQNSSSSSSSSSSGSGSGSGSSSSSEADNNNIAIGWFPTSFMTKIESQQKDLASNKAKRFWIF